MGRRLADATKAWRTRRTRGEMGLRFFLVVYPAAVFFAGCFFAGLLAEVGRDVVLFGDVLSGDVLFDAAL
jgi:hypothetical protein